MREKGTVYRAGGLLAVACALWWCAPATGQPRACCMPDGNCMDFMDPGWCIGQGGVPQAPGSDCANVACTPFKWAQPPEPAYPENVYYGWNEYSEWWYGPVAADDWLCEGPEPVTKVRWWGSYIGLLDPMNAFRPSHFHIQFWTDVQPDPGDPNGFSHPGMLVHEVYCYNFREEFVGWDFDPRSGMYEACFRYEQDLMPQEYFYQEEPGTIYWISISACYDGELPEHVWGWKTRPRVFGDDAVVITAPIQPMPGAEFLEGHPLWWPTPEDSWDLAFELFSGGPSIKWEQPPDPSLPGLHDADPSIILADDWLCEGGDVTDFHWYGNYELDADGNEVRGAGIADFRLSIHFCGPGPQGWCVPMDPPLWEMFVPFALANETDTGLVNVEGSPIYRYDYMLDFPFPQEPGTYFWFDVQALPFDFGLPPLWRWQEARRGFPPPLGHAPAAEWTPFGMWQTIVWGQPPEERYSDMAFDVTSGGPETVKWSQPPEPYIPDDAYHGWDEYSEYGGYQIAADDWVCLTDLPVTDVHWWGSFLRWSHPYPPELPQAFHIGIWTDDPGAGGDPPFSHPATLIWEHVCDDYEVEFVGWDFDPREVDGIPVPPEATFKFSQLLPDDAWFHQPGDEGIYWVSIAAIRCCYGDLNDDGAINNMDLAAFTECYGMPPAGNCARADLNCDGAVDPADLQIIMCLIAGTPPEECCGGLSTYGAYPFGWKTRPRYEDAQAPDAAVMVSAPTTPSLDMAGYSQYEQGWPIWYPDASHPWDLAFVLTTQPEPEPEPKWTQPPHPGGEGFDAASDLWLHEVLPGIKWEQPDDPDGGMVHAHDWLGLNGEYQQLIVADDWECEGGVVTDFHWWGDAEDLGAGPWGFLISIHADAAVACLPADPPLWEAMVPMSEITVTPTSDPGVMKYDYQLPEGEWFPQEPGQRYWLNLSAISNDPAAPYLWRWHEHNRSTNPILCPAVEKDLPYQPQWHPITWGVDPTRYSDLAFVVTSQNVPVPEVNKVMADDFISDGRPIEMLRWWGSYLDERFMPEFPDQLYEVDGWLISFHHESEAAPACPPGIEYDPPPLVLGLYFAPVQAVQIVGLDMVDCLGHPVYEYRVRLADCCLLCRYVDPRTGFQPADDEAFFEEAGLRYWLDIQAVTGATWMPIVAPPCQPAYTGHMPSDLPGNDGHFWGWHTSPIGTVPGRLDSACTGHVIVPPLTPEPYCPDYDQWDVPLWLCPDTPGEPVVHMAFELLTTMPGAPQACCLPSGACIDVLPMDCVFGHGGRPQGVGTVCAPGLCAPCLGDSNCDGRINWRDIDFFVAAQNDNYSSWYNTHMLLLGAPPDCPFANNNVNGDNTVNWRDIDPFVALQNTTCP